MIKVRQDAWSHEDDLLLAETVLRHIREGSTQLNAFEEVGDHLNRTSAACGFRWNAEVRRKYDAAVDLAKRQRKEKKRALAQSVQTTQPLMSLTPTYEPEENHQEYRMPTQHTEQTISFDTVIKFMKQLKRDTDDSSKSKQTLLNTEAENIRLQQEVQSLEARLTETKSNLKIIQEDYHAFIQIMDRARKMTVLEDTGSLQSPAFRMDKNGNLEQLANGSS